MAKKRVGKEGRIKQEREREREWGQLMQTGNCGSKTSKNTALTIKGDNNQIQSVQNRFPEGVQDENKKVKGKGVEKPNTDNLLFTIRKREENQFLQAKSQNYERKEKRVVLLQTTRRRLIVIDTVSCVCACVCILAVE